MNTLLEMKRPAGNATPPKACFSYIRFSSKLQAKGDSLRRQMEIAPRIAKEKGWDFREDLCASNLGVSAYKGDNIETIQSIIDAAKTGKIHQGTVMIVEALDRVSRAELDRAYDLFRDLLRAGVEIYVDKGSRHYTRESLKNPIDLLIAIVELGAANEYSAKLADRERNAWQQKRELATKLAASNGKGHFAGKDMLTGRLPAWFDVTIKKEGNRVVDRTVKVNPKAAETIRQLFDLKLEGFGKLAIERKLNQTASWIPENGWRASYIDKILHSRAVIGEGQPHKLDENGKRVPDGNPISNYYEPIVDLGKFTDVQEKFKKNRGKGGKTGKAYNVFQNLVRCGYCGGPMHFIDKGDWKSLMCDNGRRGVKGKDGKPKCHAYWVLYAEFETTVLDNLAKLRPETVLPNTDAAAKEAKLLRGAIAGLEAQVAAMEDEQTLLRKNLRLVRSEKLVAECQRDWEELETKKVKLRAERVQNESTLRDLERGQESFEKWQKDLCGLKKAIAKDVDSRIRLKTHLKDLIDHIDVFAKGHEDDLESAIALVEYSRPEMARAKSFRDFQKYLYKRLLSPDGRCYRVFRKTVRPASSRIVEKAGRKYTIVVPPDPGLQLAPESSLASTVSVKPGKEGMKFSAPKLAQLCEEFFDGRKPGQFAPKASAL